MIKKLSFLTALLAVSALLVSCNAGTDGKSAGAAAADSTAVSAPVSAGDIAYFNVDEVEANYAKATDMKAEFENKYQDILSKLERRGKNIQNEYQQLMEKYQKGLILQASAEKQSQEIQKKQDAFNKEYSAQQDQFAEEQMVLQNNIMNDIAEYVRKYNEDHGYRMILANQTGLLSFPVVLADPAMNITQDIIDGLNQEYVASK